ncbi:MAG: PspC domain-containing protein [Actinomycetota bacterium]
MSSNTDSLQTEQATPPLAEKRLYRSRTEKILGGVCGGLGDYFAIDPVWFRIGFVVLALGGGSGILIYLLMWLIVPEQPAGYEPTPGAGTSVNGAAVIGIVLMFVGTVALVNAIAPWFGRYFWPAILVVGGLALVMGGINRDDR